MTQDTKTFDAASSRGNGSEFRLRQVPADDFFLSDEEFRFAADCERMRVDRNGSVLSLLLVRLHQRPNADTTSFARLLERRLRVTDTPGYLKDGRVAILLPDTLARGAWKVAADISEFYPPGPGRPECEVLVYPGNGQGLDFDWAAEDGSAEHDDSSGESPQESADEITANRVHDAAAGGSSESEEFFFAETHPLWKRSLVVLAGSIGSRWTSARDKISTFSKI